MTSLLRTLAPALLGLSTLAAQSPEFSPLFSVVERSWPEKNRVGVVCDYQYSKGMVDELAQSAPAGTIIHVIDAPSAARLPAAQTLLHHKNIDYLVLLPRDPVFFEGGFPATMLVGNLALNGVPSVGTRPVGLKQGVVFSIGPDTHGELLVTDKLVGTVSVILPNLSAKADLPPPTTETLYPRGVTVNLLRTAE